MFKKIILASAILLAFTACSEEKKAIAKKALPLPVDVVIVKNTNIPLWLKYTGKTQATSSQEVRARVSGILEEVYYQDGDYVKKGQKLFKIEQTVYIANLQFA
jgi:membrane fusion protein (multidrug efflux system)